MSYFCGLSIDEVRKLTNTEGDLFNHSLVALRFARLSNGVSQLHGHVSREMWKKYEGICPIISITNAELALIGPISKSIAPWKKATTGL